MNSQRLHVSIPAWGVGVPNTSASSTRTQKLAEGVRATIAYVVGWVKTQRTAKNSAKRLRVAETVSFGEKRFVAVVQVDGLQFLVGGSATGVTLLAQLGVSDSFETSLASAMNATKPRVKRQRPSNKKQVACVEEGA